jgi:predicted DNA-binding antitoxin AbrB/MazE fold protein
MTQIDAIYQEGVFKPLGPVTLSNNERVRLSIHPASPTDPLVWLEEARQFRQQLLAKHGPFPDIAGDIAADRGRDD